jgi:hypothetical protein
MSVNYNKAYCAPPVDGVLKPAVAKPASKQHPSVVYLFMCRTRSSATKNVARGIDKTRFPSIVFSNTKQGFSVKNMEVMYTNLLEWALPTAEDHHEHGHEGQQA